MEFPGEFPGKFPGIPWKNPGEDLPGNFQRAKVAVLSVRTDSSTDVERSMNILSHISTKENLNLRDNVFMALVFFLCARLRRLAAALSVIT